ALVYCMLCTIVIFFFFQAEDGIRDRNVTGVQTCALPICAKQLAEMTNVVNERNIQVIYVDPTTSTTISETVSQATGAELRPLRTLEFITEEEIEQGEDYFSIMRENLAQLTK